MKKLTITALVVVISLVTVASVAFAEHGSVGGVGVLSNTTFTIAR
ncbi:MAG TPA: hypothetical protein VNT01_11715 [Symbiobacteriaceae bacterium]|nr:hypothetical protein [Symbiobacteriaceae bacterium]